MPSPHANRHLRHVTGLAALREHELQQTAAQCNGQQQVIASTVTTDDAFAGKPGGGRVRVLVAARGITSGEVPPPGEPTQPGVKVPTLDITVEGRDLHAPLIERLVELPMDISAGRVSCLRIAFPAGRICLLASFACPCSEGLILHRDDRRNCRASWLTGEWRTPDLLA